MMRFVFMFTSLLIRLSPKVSLAAARADLTSSNYVSVQAAVDANPGCMVYVPNGDHLLTETVMITPLLVLQGSGIKTLGLAQTLRCEWRDGYIEPHLAKSSR
jgi:hypothetical protein